MIGAFSLEVIALYMVMAAIAVATPSKPHAIAFSLQTGLAVLAKHVRWL